MVIAWASVLLLNDQSGGFSQLRVRVWVSFHYYMGQGSALQHPSHLESYCIKHAKYSTPDTIIIAIAECHGTHQALILVVSPFAVLTWSIVLCRSPVLVMSRCIGLYQTGLRRPGPPAPRRQLNAADCGFREATASPGTEHPSCDSYSIIYLKYTSK